MELEKGMGVGCLWGGGGGGGGGEGGNRMGAPKFYDTGPEPLKCMDATGEQQVPWGLEIDKHSTTVYE